MSEIDKTIEELEQEVLADLSEAEMKTVSYTHLTLPTKA